MEHAAKHERTHRLDVQNTNLWRQDLPASVDALLSAFTCASSNVNDESDFLAKLQHIFDEFRAMIFQRRQDLLRDVNLFQESNALVVIQLIPIFSRSPFFWRCHTSFVDVRAAASTKLDLDHRDEDP